MVQDLSEVWGVCTVNYLSVVWGICWWCGVSVCGVGCLSVDGIYALERTGPLAVCSM